MRIDGEPWKQPLPEDDGKVIVEITHLGQVMVLATRNCIARSMHNGSLHLTESTDGSSESVNM
jgi:diacylglycerol kinase (ATP)